MPPVNVPDRTWRLFSVNNFSGGMAVPPRDDTEASLIQNFEIARNGILVTRPGTVKYNTTDLGTGLTMGLGYGQPSANKLMFVVKSGTIWYRTMTTGYPANFSSITCPATGDNPVNMEPVEAGSTAAAPGAGRYQLFTCPNWSRIQQWDGSAAATSDIAGASPSPANCRYIRLAGQRVYAAGQDANPYTVYFSDPGDPFTWPTGNSFSVPASRGKIRGLERQSGVLLIITERAILQLQGDPPDNYRLTTIHENLGSDCANTISTVGAVTAFLSGFGPMMLSGGVQAFGDKIRNEDSFDSSSHLDTTYGLLTPYYYFMRTQPPNGANPAGSGSSEYLWVYDRLRFQSWVKYEYPTTTAIGASNGSYQPMIWDDYADCLVLAAGNGSLYAQPFHNLLVDEAYTFTQDAGSTPVDVTSAYRGRYLDFGDAAMQKQFRRILAGGQWADISVQVDSIGKHGALSTAAPIISYGMMYSTDRPSIGTSGRPSLFSQMRLYISGTEMVLRNWSMAWRPSRLSAQEHTP